MFEKGTMVKITSGIEWLDDLKPSLYKPKESEIGLIGMVIDTKVLNDEVLYRLVIANRTIRRSHNIILAEKYLEIYKENISKSGYETWKNNQDVISVEAYEKLSKSITGEREVGNMNKNIILMWAQKMKEGYMKSRDEEISQIKKSDVIFKKKNELEVEMCRVMEATGLNINNIRPVLVFENVIDGKGIATGSPRCSISTLFSKGTRDAIDEIFSMCSEKIKFIDEKSKEVITMIEGCETYEKTIEVLQVYDIVNDKGKLLLPDTFDLE